MSATRTSIVTIVLAGLALAPAGNHALASDQPLAASAHAIAIDPQIDWSAAKLIAVQDGGRYKTLDSFAREMMSSMYGREHLRGLSPLASLLDWIFRSDAYADSPVVRIKDKGLRIHVSAHMPDAQRTRIVSTGYLTPREMADPVVRDQLDELETLSVMASAMRRAREAQFVSEMLDRLANLVPDRTGDPIQPWHTPEELLANLSDEQIAAAGLRRTGAVEPVPNYSPDQAVSVLGPWFKLRAAWLKGDAAGVQASLDTLAERLPQLAAPGVYPDLAQRVAEARYYGMGKFTWGYILYALAAIVSIWAVITQWRTPWVIAFVMTALAASVHGYGLALRWGILGRIPVANMFEAVVASALGGVLIAMVLEVIFRMRVFLFGANFVGFLSLVLGAFVIPGQGTITTIMGILDDVMLRIHTVLIILSYALIALAAVLAVLYLYGFYLHRQPKRSAETGIWIGGAGLVLWAALRLWVYAGPSSGAAAPTAAAFSQGVFTVLAVLGFVMLPIARMLPATTRFYATAAAGVAAFGGLLVAATPAAFALWTAGIMCGGGLAWSALTGIGQWWAATTPEFATSAGLAFAGGRPGAALRDQRPVLAGGAPGDEGKPAGLPLWLVHCDWCHLIILNLVVVMLFVGTILGAVWADYSWGRPWGWDPKEVFALNTWIIYAILIHIRFITKDRGLWTAWLSIGGCAMMAFNWCFVNFFIVGLHSYA